MKSTFTEKILLAAVLFTLLALSGTVLAAGTFTWQTPWPKSPMGTDIAASSNPSLAVAIKYLYEWGVGLGGVAVFVSLIIAGFEYITSMGNPPKMQEAFNRIRDAVIGLIVLLSSYAILSLIGINLTNMKVDMFQSNFNTPAIGCKTADGSAAPACCKNADGTDISGCNPDFFTCKGWDSNDPASTGICYSKSAIQECGSAIVYYEVGGSMSPITDFGVEHVIDPNKRIQSVIFKDVNGKICYDPSYPAAYDPSGLVSSTTNLTCNCDLQLFTQSTTVTGGNVSNPCANADVYAAPNYDSLKIYNDAKEVVCVSLIKS